MIRLIERLKLRVIGDPTTKIYTFAMLLSLASTIFGVLREVLLIKVLGFTSTNDYLQIYISLYFAICAFSEPVRLIYLNLISARYFQQLLLFLLSLVTIIGTVITFTMWQMQSKLQLSSLFLAALDGLLGVFVALVIFHKQRFGAYLISQIINVIPNFVLVPAVIFLSFLPRQFYILNFLLAFLFLHTIQLVWLLFVKSEYQDKDKQNLRWGDFVISVRHFISILGEQFFQIAGRLLFLSLGPGYVTLLSLFLKCLLTGRFIFIDSFIGPNLHKWSFNQTKDTLFSLLDNHWVNFGIILPTLLFCLIHKISLFFMSLQLTVVFLGAFYFSSIYKIGYFKINRFIHYGNLVTFVGLFDLSFSLLIYFFAKKWYASADNAMLYVFSWYLVRLPIELFVLKQYYRKAQIRYQVVSGG